MPKRAHMLRRGAVILASGIVPVAAFTAWGGGPSWILMWIVILALFISAKIVLWHTFAPSDASWYRFLRYCLTYPGMDTGPFLERDLPEPVTATESAAVTGQMLLGIVLIWAITRCAFIYDHLLAGYIGMVGIFVLLGFAIPAFASVLLRQSGVNAKPIMRNPLLAKSLADFWGRRWNRAFRDVMYLFVCDPLVPKLGRGGTLLTVFLVSGLVHELVISFPSCGGIGGPTAYFLVQAFGILVQRRLIAHHRAILCRISTFACLVGPLPLLYPPLFVDRVVLPFLRVIGAT